jgi:hypothetical protein
VPSEKEYIQKCISGTPFDGYKIDIIELGVNTTAKLTDTITEKCYFFKSGTFTTGTPFETEVQLHTKLEKEGYPTTEVLFDGSHLEYPFFITEFYSGEHIISEGSKLNQRLMLGSLASRLAVKTAEWNISGSGKIQYTNTGLQAKHKTVSEAVMDFATRLYSQTSSQLAETVYTSFESLSFPAELESTNHVLCNMDMSFRNVLWVNPGNSLGCTVVDWGDCKWYPWQVLQVITEFYGSHMIEDRAVREEYRENIRTGFRTLFGNAINSESEMYKYLYLFHLLRKTRGLEYTWCETESEKQQQKDLVRSELEILID